MISLAYAQTAAAAAPQGDAIGSFLPMIVILIIFWIFMIRPQMKRAKEHKNLLAQLQKGDEVVTQGGVVGRVQKVDENYVVIVVSNNTKMMVQKPAITMVLPKGTLKSQGIEVEH